MDLSRAEELKRQILGGLQGRSNRVCTTSQGPLDAHRPTVLVNVGQDWARLGLRSVKYGRHVLRVKTAHTKTQSFRETKDGWFMVDRVVSHILECMDIEGAARRRASRDAQLMATAGSAIKRLEKRGVPDGVSLSISRLYKGRIDITACGLSEKAVGKLLEIVRREEAKPEKGKRELWDHLQESDD